MRRRTRAGLAAVSLLNWTAIAATLIVRGASPVAADDFYAGRGARFRSDFATCAILPIGSSSYSN
jgi:hypothetical protein